MCVFGIMPYSYVLSAKETNKRASRYSVCSLGIRSEKMKIRAEVKSECGATAVELTFSLMAFLVFIIVTIEAGIIGFRTLTAQWVASQTAREAAIFGGDEGTGDVNITLVRNYSHNLASNRGLNLPSIEEWEDDHFQVCRLEDIESIENVRCTDGNNFGVAEDFVSVRIAIPTRFFLQALEIEVIGWGVARNEPF